MTDQPTAVDASTMNSLMATIRIAFPDAEVSEECGEITINTGLKMGEKIAVDKHGNADHKLIKHEAVDQ